MDATNHDEIHILCLEDEDHVLVSFYTYAHEKMTVLNRPTFETIQKVVYDLSIVSII